MINATPLKDWMRSFGLNRNNAAKKLNIPTSTFYALYRDRDCIVVNNELYFKYNANLKLQEPRK